MAPSAKALREALIQGTCDVFKLGPDTTTVNKVRHHVEQELGLDEDFFNGGDWKQKSKEIIKEHVGKLIDGWVPEEKKDAAKRSKPAAKKQANDNDSNGDTRESSSPERKRKRTAANDEEDKGESDESNQKAKSESMSPDPVVDEEEEYSDVIDEPPTPKRKKTKKDAGAKHAKAAKASKPTKPSAKKSSTATEPSDPEEAEIKKLQGQLAKCGVRKMWHNELKDCDDARSKIRHLKKMLADIGMEGRFSEAKAREIKETRELLADAEAAQEMNRLWGMDSGGRRSRKNRGVKMVESDGSDAENGNDDNDDDGDHEHEKGEKDNGNDDDDDEDVSFAARRRRAHADLAFLGDDSDSD